jgi:hypothetical protein
LLWRSVVPFPALASCAAFRNRLRQPNMAAFRASAAVRFGLFDQGITSVAFDYTVPPAPWQNRMHGSLFLRRRRSLLAAMCSHSYARRDDWFRALFQTSLRNAGCEIQHTNAPKMAHCNALVTCRVAGTAKKHNLQNLIQNNKGGNTCRAVCNLYSFQLRIIRVVETKAQQNCGSTN